MPDLAVLIPTRGRPDNIRKVIAAWDFTNAWDHADMVLIVDADDPELEGYRRYQNGGWAGVSLVTVDEWTPMVHKLNRVAVYTAESRLYQALGFAGDDHLPRTINWAQRYLTVLRELGTGMVYGDDGYQGANLSTEWAVTADVVRELGRMVPADVEHVYCDNAIMEMFAAAGALRHLPEIRIEHMHPIVGKAESDEQYRRVNHRDQFSKDRAAYTRWQSTAKPVHVRLVRQLRGDRPDAPAPATRKTKIKKEPKVKLPFPRFFKQVRGATPPEIELTLADMAAQVPADQEIVELGVFQGRTALIMAWGADQGHGAHVTAIDAWDLEGNTYGPPFIDVESRRWAKHHVQSLGYSNKITLIQAFSHEVAEKWVDDAGEYPKLVGLLFVDGDHSEEGARRDIESWAPHLAPGAVIAVDDYGHPDWPGVALAVDALVAEGVLEPIKIFHDRLAVTRLAGVEPIKLATGDGAAVAEERAGVEPGTGNVTAITSEGVATSLEPQTYTGSSNDFVDPQEGPALGLTVGAKIDDLNLGQLRTLARHRKIILGRRKDKRAEILQALRDGA